MASVSRRGQEIDEKAVARFRRYYYHLVRLLFAGVDCTDALRYSQSLALDYKAMNSPSEPADKKKKDAKGKSKADGKVESLLHKIKWRRVVLDEGHVIKNRTTLMSLACAALIAESVLFSWTLAR